ncbi:hypothetical protein ACVWXN_000519 [Bradyrhizobium sp. i1.4.4]
MELRTLVGSAARLSGSNIRTRIPAARTLEEVSS